jgi:hypothetical protein
VSKKKRSKPVVGIAWFRGDQWQRLLEVSADRDSLERGHAEWERHASQTVRKLSQEGFDVRKVPIDVEELVAWCLTERRPIDGSARAELAGRKVRGATSGLSALIDAADDVYN